MISACSSLLRAISLAAIIALFLTLLGAPADAASRPSISSISPTTGPLGGGTKVTITGKYLTWGSKVKFGEFYGTGLNKLSSEKITIIAPANPAGTVNVTVKTGGGTSNVKTFTYRVPPTISSVSPASGKTTGGAKLSISGASFVNSTYVYFGATKVLATVVDSTHLTATTPAHAAGEVQLKVANKYGETPNAAKFTYETPPQVTQLKVGSFNVRTASKSLTAPTNSRELLWPRRVPVVAQQIEDSDLDVIGVQEASASDNYSVDPDDTTQFQDIVNALGSPYALTNSNRYCYEHDNEGRCNDGASSSDRIIYNTAELTLKGQGSRKLDDTGPTEGSGRYMVWAIFEDKDTAKKFFFVNTHLEPGSSSETVRKGQAATILDEIDTQNTTNLPVILVGDLGATKFSSTNYAHAGFVADGFRDPLVNTYRFDDTSDNRLPDTMINTQYSSLNDFDPAPQRVTKGSSDLYKIGSYIDYIMTRGGDFTYNKWETVLDLKPDGDFDGVIPSDHNLVTLDLTLR